MPLVSKGATPPLHVILAYGILHLSAHTNALLYLSILGMAFFRSPVGEALFKY
jgi:hypothetical protein